MGNLVRTKDTSAQKSIPVIFLLKCLLFSYILTGVLLLLLAFILYKANLSERAVAAAIIAVYVAATFFSGFVTGRRMQTRKFLWGLLMGASYFLVLTLISLIVHRSAQDLTDSFFTTLVLCAGGGMLGGMIS